MVYHVFLGAGTFPTYRTNQGVIGYSGWNNSVQYTTPDFNGLSGSVMCTPSATPQAMAARRSTARSSYTSTARSRRPACISITTPGFKSQSVGQLGASASFDMK